MLVRRTDLGDARDQGSARHGHGAALREHAPREPSDWHRDGELGRLRIAGPRHPARAAIGNADRRDHRHRQSPASTAASRALGSPFAAPSAAL